METLTVQLLFLSLLLTSLFTAGNATFITDPPTANGGTSFLAARVNATNIPVFCEIRLGGQLRVTAWFLTEMNRERRRLVFNLEPNFSIGDPYQSSVNILTFSENLNMSLLECTNTFEPPNLQHAFFILRFIEPPLLKSEPNIMTTSEGDVFSFNLEQNPGFPLVPVYQWFFNGEKISASSINPNVSVYPHIVFDPVLRSQSGNYSMTTNTKGENSTGYFILNVLAPPDGTQGPNEVFAVTGIDTTITSFTDVTGNPTPNSTWMRNGITLSSGTMYGTDTTGVLMIFNIMLSDTGNYTNTLLNMFNNESFTKNFTISLQVLSPPSPPQNLTVANVSSTSIALKWLNPITIGVPAFARFTIELASTSKHVFLSASAVSDADFLFTNTFFVTGLDPNTNYTIGIRAVSTHPAMGDLVSDSIMQAITTNASVPQFDQIILENVYGMLRLEWTFSHTGGLPLQSISVTCSGGGSAVLSNISLCTPNMCDSGSSSLGSVDAGRNYTCAVTATNAVGNSTSTSNSVITFTGIPSTPSMFILFVEQLVVRLQFTVAFAGVEAGENSLYFNVSVYNTTSNNLQYISLFPMRNNFLGFSVIISHNFTLQPGTYQFSSTANNRYGSSLESRLTTLVTLVQGYDESQHLITIIVGVCVSLVITTSTLAVLITGISCYVVKKRHNGLVGKNATKSKRYNNQQTTSTDLQHVWTVENESYGVLGGVPQSIELKENAAYTTINQQPALNPSIAVNNNVVNNASNN